MINLYGKLPKIENELIALFKAAIQEGRTTAGLPQKNYSSHFSSRPWEPLAVFENK